MTLCIGFLSLQRAIFPGCVLVRSLGTGGMTGIFMVWISVPESIMTPINITSILLQKTASNMSSWMKDGQ